MAEGAGHQQIGSAVAHLTVDGIAGAAGARRQGCPGRRLQQWQGIEHRDAGTTSVVPDGLLRERASIEAACAVEPLARPGPAAQRYLIQPR